MAKVKLSFEEWMKAVDAALVAKCGIASSDLPDCPYSQWFEDGKTPTGAAAKAIKAAQE